MDYEDLDDVCDKLSLCSTSVDSLKFESDSDDSRDVSSDESKKCKQRAEEKHELIDGRVVFDYERHETIPELVYTFDKECLKELFLDYNELKQIPDEFCVQLSQLRVLSLMGNKLTQLPTNINLMDQLEELFIDENKFNQLTEELCQLSGLKRLHSQGNCLKTVPEGMGALKQLQYLKLNENKLNSLPQMFGLLESLEELDLSYNTLLELPQTFGSLQSLRILNISYNKLKSLPESFGDLPNLVVLELSSNNLNFLPKTLCSANRLRKLFLDSNEIVVLPEWFGDLEQLEELCLKSNYLRGAQFPDRFGTVSQKLVKFDISGNLVEELPESFAQLKALQFFDTGSPLFEPERRKNLRNGNNIQYLPKYFGIDFTFMKDLRLDENNIEELPECFGEGMPNLEVLDLYCNNIELLPDSFCKLKSLRVLSIGMNILKKFPPNFGDLSALEELRAELNELKSLPQSFDKLAKLRVLDLYKNKFVAFPSILKNLENIKSLQVGLNVSDMVVQIESCQQFKIKRLERAISFGIPNRKKITNFFVEHSSNDLSEFSHTLPEFSQNSLEFNKHSNESSSQESSQEEESISSSIHSSGYCSLHTSEDKVCNTDGTSGLEESWDFEAFDPQKPYLHEPLFYPNNHRIQTPLDQFKHFIPLRLHAPKIKRNKRVKLSPVDGQFDSPDNSDCS